MKRSILALALSFLLIAPVAGLAGNTTILDCNFDDKAVGELIGTGGAALHEPSSRDGIPATVRTQPFVTPSLEMTENWGFGARAVRFEFLDNMAITAGTLSITFDLYFVDMNGFNLYIREKSGAAVSFLSVNFTSDGSIIGSSLNDGFNGLIGTYTTGIEIPVALTYHLDSLTFGLSIGGNVPLINQPLGAIPEGIGSILLGLDHDADSAGTFHLDNLLVIATQLPDPVAATTWSRVKALAAQ